MLETLLANSYVQNKQYHRLIDLAESHVAKSDDPIDILVMLYKEGFQEIAYDLICERNAKRPTTTNLKHLEALCLQQSLRHEKALEVFEYLERLAISKGQFYYTGLLHRQYMSNQTHQSEFAATKKLVSVFKESRSFLHLAGSFKKRRIRIAYLSEDFCSHPVGLLAQSFVLCHSDKFEVTVFHTGKRDDAVTSRYRSLTRLFCVSSYSKKQIASVLSDGKFDVIVDLTGYTAGSRTSLLACRIAPLQGCFLGYLGSTGLPNVDFTISDDSLIFSGVQSWFSEEIVSLGDSKICFQPLDFYPKIIGDMGFAHRQLSFGSFSNTAKFTDQTISLWAAVLANVKHSKLILKWNSFRDSRMRNRLFQKFEENGIERERIELREFSPHRDLLNEYADIDICLDTFPFSGLYTSLEALWMGVPVVTLFTDRIASRQTYALLTTLGLQSLAAETPSEFVKTVVSISRSRNELSQLKGQIRKKMESSVLMNTDRYVQRYEQELIRLLHARIK